MTTSTNRNDHKMENGEPLVQERVGGLNFNFRKSVPVILQTEAAECALACLAMVAGHYGFHTNLYTLRAKFPSSLRGTRLSDLIQMAESLGLSARPVKVEASDVKQLYMPCILHWDLNHFVVLTRVSGKKINVIDPSFGERALSVDEFNRHFTGVALELARGPEFTRSPKRPPISLRALAGSVSGLSKGLFQVFSLAIGLEVCALLAPQFMQVTMDQVLADKDAGLLTLLGMSFTALLVIQVALTALRTWTVVWISTHFSLGWSGNVFHHLVRLPMEYFSKRYLGDIISRFGAIATIQQTLTTKFVEVVLDGAMAMITGAMLFFYSIPLAFTTLAFACAYAGARVLYFRVYREANLSQVVVAAKQQGNLIESIRAVQTIKLHNQTAERTAQFMNLTAETLNTSVKVQKLGLAFDALNGMTTGLQKIVVLWMGAYLALTSEFTIGMVVAFVAYADQFTTRFNGLVSYTVQLRLLRIQGERLADIVLTKPETSEVGDYTGPISNTTIEFCNVTFGYAEGEPPVLRNLNLCINPGQIVAITGASGCGKSTIAKLALGLLDQQDGEVLFGGVDIRHLGKRRLREAAASVMQDDQLFSGTIFENISLFDTGADIERVQDAAKQARIHDEICLMPMGYHTIIGDMGSSLSGGQQQRLILARAFYRKPKILILDEATSHLDLDNERLICDAVREARITTILIAHRPHTVNSADRIVRLRGGLVESVDITDERKFEVI
ncbi:peptidase domain-containing ABC transporter [Rhodanobacter sp. 7MK24]|uniref:peptidase domain-containing ABC transporter n=1 Tax=Rhodanobacter sp. 7MK24 TaxID=2775922 RepID=UPI00177CFCB4|nr:peptidase domain-containing ABC transporter [Rhodanobacter sp. 7MK24]MBD8882428.1 peptidase domain-containing ABC transporter [Rhodanobacter sp. 7MK24]